MNRASSQQKVEKCAGVQDASAVNPHWLAFWREVKRLADLIRERESAANGNGTVSTGATADQASHR